MRVSRPLPTILITIIIIVGGFFFLLRGCLAKYDERAALAPILYFEKDGRQVVFTIVKFDKATSYSQKGGFVSKSVRTSYYIQSNDAATGNKLNEKKIRTHKSIKHYPVHVLGASGQAAWVFLGEIMAFDPFTLEEIASAESLQEKNPAIKGKLPAEERYYKFNQSDKNIYFTALDGSRWKLDTRSLQMTAAEETDGLSETGNQLKQLEKLQKLNQQKQDSLHEQKSFRPARMLQAKEITMAQYQQIVKGYYDERSQLYRERDSLRDLASAIEKKKDAIDDIQKRIASLSEATSQHYSQIRTNQDTLQGKWFGLYTAKEIEKLYNRVQYQPAYEETARRQLYISNYGLSKHGDYLIDKDNAAAASSSLYFLDGGFLLDKQTAMPVHLPGGDWLVIYKNQIGNDGLIQLSRITQDGKQVWTADTGLKQWADYQYTGKYLLLLGVDNRELSSNELNVLRSIDLATGKMAVYDFFTDK